MDGVAAGATDRGVDEAEHGGAVVAVVVAGDHDLQSMADRDAAGVGYERNAVTHGLADGDGNGFATGDDRDPGPAGGFVDGAQSGAEPARGDRDGGGVVGEVVEHHDPGGVERGDLGVELELDVADDVHGLGHRLGLPGEAVRQRQRTGVGGPSGVGGQIQVAAVARVVFVGGQRAVGAQRERGELCFGGGHWSEVRHSSVPGMM